MKKMFKFYKQHREIINYLFVGGFTTVVSIATFALFMNVLGLSAVASNVISWIIVIIIAYFLNRYLVFVKHATDFKGLVREIVTFIMARIATLLLETFVVWLGIDVMKINSEIGVVVVKTFGQVLVVVSNYILSKFLIFKNTNKADNNADRVRNNTRNRKR
ncbi:GtrA family protein [Candidatus Saccharibacteria bacterium]|nr:GtrA family protein [Candidatus Saccharibacteria bacterium]